VHPDYLPQTDRRKEEREPPDRSTGAGLGSILRPAAGPRPGNQRSAEPGDSAWCPRRL